MAEYNATVRIYDPHAEVQATINEIQRSGFAINRLSIVGKDYHIEERVIGDANVSDRIKVWRQFGDFWGGLSGLLLGSAFYFIPGIGPVMVFGPLVSWIVRALEGAVMVGELSALGAGLYSIGILKNNIMEYEKALKSDKFIVVAHGTPNDMAKANSILEGPGAAQIAPILRGALHQRASVPRGS
jgi:hypothetical protein